MATPRQKKKKKQKGTGGYVRAATARGYSDKSRLDAEGIVPATPGNLAGGSTATGCAGVLIHASRFALAYQRLSTSC